jgi:hypothetical protein
MYRAHSVFEHGHLSGSQLFRRFPGRDFKSFSSKAASSIASFREAMLAIEDQVRVLPVSKKLFVSLQLKLLIIL